MKKVKNKKNYFDTFKWTSSKSETTFCVITQSKKSLLAYTAHTLAKIKRYLSGLNKIKNYFSPQVPYK